VPCGAVQCWQNGFVQDAMLLLLLLGNAVAGC